MILIYLVVVTLATWQTVEILHHSKIGTFWRVLGKFMFLLPKPFSWIGYGMTCPFCYSNWIGIMYCLIVARPTTLMNGVIAVIAGIGAARLANFLNDYFKSCCNTPNDNEDSASYRAQQQQSEEPVLKKKQETTIEVQTEPKSEPVNEGTPDQLN
jgi:hypothetical protein